MGGLNQSAERASETGNFNRRNLLEETNEVVRQASGAVKDMSDEYWLMHSHKYQKLDDYYHCKANYKAAKRGEYGERVAEALGNEKEYFDYYKNQMFRGLNQKEAYDDYSHDMNINQIGRNRAKDGNFNSAQEACADFRKRNKALPEEYW